MALPWVQQIKILISKSVLAHTLVKQPTRCFSSALSRNLPISYVQTSAKYRTAVTQTDLNSLFLSTCRKCQLSFLSTRPWRTTGATASGNIVAHTRPWRTTGVTASGNIVTHTRPWRTTGVTASGNIVTHTIRHNATTSRAERSSKSALLKAASLKRSARNNQPPEEKEEIMEHRNVAAYAVGTDFHLFKLQQAIQQEHVYEVVILPEDVTDVLMVTAKYRLNGKRRDILFFRDGGVACWNMSETERREIVKFSSLYAVNPNNFQEIIDDSEIFPVVADKVTRLVKNKIHMKTMEDELVYDEELALQKYAFSNALTQSVKLSVSENSLEHFIEELEPETHRLRQGKKSKLTKKNINMKQGDMFLLRHEINLESGLLDTPDIYWERDDLEDLYRQMILYLYLPKRIRVINERLNYCSEILGLFHNQLNDQHHVRLEWIIILLIMIEVVFECIHYIEKYRSDEIVQPTYEAGQPGNVILPVNANYNSNDSDKQDANYSLSKSNNKQTDR